MKQSYVWGAAVVLVILLAAWFLVFNNTSEQTDGSDADFVAPTEDSQDVATQYYGDWHTAAQDGSLDTIPDNVLTQPRVSESVASAIQSAMDEFTVGDVHPVFCQADLPDRFGTKSVYTQVDAAEFLVLPRGTDSRSPNQTVLSLKAVDGAWQISDISCTQGETAPDREFSFEQSGYLLKDGLPEPLDSSRWHLVYERDGEMGYTIPLYVTEASECVANDGTTTQCDEADFANGTAVFIQADMIEAGAEIRRLERQ